MHAHTQVQSEIYKEQHFNIQFLKKRYWLNSTEGASLFQKTTHGALLIPLNSQSWKTKFKKVSLVQLSNSVQMISWSELKVNWKKSLHFHSTIQSINGSAKTEERKKETSSSATQSSCFLFPQGSNSLTSNSREMGLNLFSSHSVSVFVLVCWILSLIQCLMFSFSLPWENV